MGRSRILIGVAAAAVLLAMTACASFGTEDGELTLSLERRERGTGWIEMASTSSSTIPSPRTTYEVKAACQAGTWRVSATARGSLQGNLFIFTDHSIERFVTIQDCERER